MCNWNFTRPLKTTLLAALVCLSADAENSQLRIQAESKPHRIGWARLLQGDRVLEDLMRNYSAKVHLPRAVPVTFADTGKVNAWYSPAQHSVTVDYSFLDFIHGTFSQDPRFRNQAQALTLRANRFFLLHELGHATMTELNLPYSGKNEDCADELAVIFASHLLGAEGRKDAQAAAQWFILVGWGKLKDVSKVPFWDEHSFDLQRHYNILIDLEASSPGLVPELSTKVSADRLARARRKWPMKLAAWGHHLGGACPNLSPSPQPAPQLGSGKFVLTFEDAQDADLLMIANEMKKHPFAKVLAAYQKLFILPRDLGVTFVNRREPICRYQNENHRVAVSYGWILDVGKFLGQQTKDAQVIMNKFGSVLTIEMLCRVQQMLIEELRIPVTGEPEDAAVELVAVGMIDDPAMQEIFIDTADYYRWKAEANPYMLTYEFSSEDDLHYQRFLDIYMALYVQHPKQFAWVLDWVPPKRLQRAQQEQPRKNKNWERLIWPYVRH
jgi:hypothetical protein